MHPLFKFLENEILIDLNFLVKFHIFSNEVEEDEAKTVRQVFACELVEDGLEEQFFVFGGGEREVLHEVEDDGLIGFEQSFIVGEDEGEEGEDHFLVEELLVGDQPGLNFVDEGDHQKQHGAEGDEGWPLKWSSFVILEVGVSLDQGLVKVPHKLLVDDLNFLT